MQSIYTPSYAGVPLDIVSHETNLAPRVVQHVPTIGRGAQLDARGRGARVDSLVVKTTGADADQREYRGWLQGLVESEAARRFVHPFDGSWLARLSAFSERAAGGSFEFSMTLLEDVPHTVRADGNRGSAATLQELSVAADVLESATVALAIEDPALASAVPRPAPMLAQVAERAPEEQSARMDSWRQQMRAAQSELRAAAGLAGYNASVALASFSGMLEQYSQARATVGRIWHLVTTRRAQPLIVHLTQLYGASNANRIMGDVTKFNQIADVLHVPAGIQLRLPRMT